LWFDRQGSWHGVLRNRHSMRRDRDSAIRRGLQALGEDPNDKSYRTDVCLLRARHRRGDCNNRGSKPTVTSGEETRVAAVDGSRASRVVVQSCLLTGSWHLAWLHDGSRMTRECPVRFCERLGVKLPGATLPPSNCRCAAPAVNENLTMEHLSRRVLLSESARYTRN